MLGRFIAQRRKERNLTQRELAEAPHDDGMGEIFTAGTKITGLYWSPACTGRRTAPIWLSARAFRADPPALTARSGISIKVRMIVGTDR